MMGYACINTNLSNRSKKDRITTNRTMIKRTFEQKGIEYASELAVQNCADLLPILQWNEKNGIRFFRLSSEFFPWASEYDLKDLPHYDQIKKSLAQAGTYAKKHNHRLTCHPGHFNKLASPKPKVVENTIRDLEIHGELFDLLGLSRTPYNKINIHVGATYGDKESACVTFNSNFKKLSDAVRSRLTVENDDKASLYSTKDLHELIWKKIGTPIVFDYHHHKFCTGGQSEEEALKLAASTWGKYKPVVHYSESRAKEQNDSKIKPQAHSDYIQEKILTYGVDVDIMVEAKAKEQALLEWSKKHGTLL